MKTLTAAYMTQWIVTTLAKGVTGAENYASGVVNGLAIKTNVIVKINL